MEIFNTLLVSLLLSTQHIQVTCASQKLILLLMDGFRWDYLDDNELGQDGFRRVMREGVKAEYLESDFPTKSGPNYYSIMTGLHVESHGMVGNSMYDIGRNETFSIGTNPGQLNPHWWNGGDPLWVTAGRQKKKSYFYYWLGCEVEIRGLRPTYCRNYTGVPSVNDTRDALEDGLDHLENDEADIVGVYFEFTDLYGHMYGPNADKVRSVLREFDSQVAYILSELDRRGLKDDVNLMLFSDHGMTSLSPNRTIDLSHRLNTTDVHVYIEGGSILYVWPEEGKVDAVYSRLLNFHPHMKVFKKEDIPEAWYFRNGRLTPPIFTVADLGWYILTPRSPIFYVYKETGEDLKGGHGYDNINQDMRGMFAAVGPAFQKNMVTKPLRVVDLYQVMCTILDIDPSPNNGTWTSVKDMMDGKYTSSGSCRTTTIADSTAVAVVFLARVLSLLRT